MKATIILSTFNLSVSLLLIFLPGRIYLFFYRTISEIPDNRGSDLIEMRKLLRRESSKQYAMKISKKISRFGLLILSFSFVIYVIELSAGSLPSEIFESFRFPFVLFSEFIAIFICMTERRDDKDGLRYPSRNIFGLIPLENDSNDFIIMYSLFNRKTLVRNFLWAIKMMFVLILVMIVSLRLFRGFIYLVRFAEGVIYD